MLGCDTGKIFCVRSVVYIYPSEDLHIQAKNINYIDLYLDI